MKKVFLIMALAFTVFACQSETKTEGDSSVDTTVVLTDSACVDSCKKAAAVK